MITSLFIDGALDGGELFLMSSCYTMTFMSTDFVSKRARHRPKVAARTDIFSKTRFTRLVFTLHLRRHSPFSRISKIEISKPRESAEIVTQVEL
jgi:hypothetical protein